jgi:hypothetical protein
MDINTGDIFGDLPDEQEKALEEVVVTREMTGQLSFDPKFAFEVALKYHPLKVIMQQYGVDKHTMRRLAQHPPFIMALKNFKREIAEQGVTFRMKAKMMSEDLLETAYLMAKNPQVPSSVRTDNIKSIVKWADLEPKKDSDSGAGGATFNLQINL